VIISFSR